jgi:hypothetical protein
MRNYTVQKMYCRAIHEAEKEKLKTTLKNIYSTIISKKTRRIQESLNNDNRTDNKIKERRINTRQR